MSSESPEFRLARIDAEIQDRLNRGETPSAGAYIAAHPDLRAGIEAIFERRRVIEGLLGSPSAPDPPRESGIAGYALAGPLRELTVGCVYDARSPSGDPVDLLVLAPGLPQDARRRVVEQAESFRRRIHEALVPVHEAGFWHGIAWVAWRRAARDGGSPASPFGEGEARRLARALSALHEAGIAHGALCEHVLDASGPGGVMIRWSGVGGAASVPAGSEDAPGCLAVRGCLSAARPGAAAAGRDVEGLAAALLAGAGGGLSSGCRRVLEEARGGAFATGRDLVRALEAAGPAPARRFGVSRPSAAAAVLFVLVSAWFFLCFQPPREAARRRRALEAALDGGSPARVSAAFSDLIAGTAWESWGPDLLPRVLDLAETKVRAGRPEEVGDIVRTVVGTGVRDERVARLRRIVENRARIELRAGDLRAAVFASDPAGRRGALILTGARPGPLEMTGGWFVLAAGAGDGRTVERLFRVDREVTAFRGQGDLAFAFDAPGLAAIAGVGEAGEGLDPGPVTLSRYRIAIGRLLRAGDPHALCHPDEPAGREHRLPAPAEDGAAGSPATDVDFFDAWAAAAWLGRRLPDPAEIDEAGARPGEPPIGAEWCRGAGTSAGRIVVHRDGATSRGVRGDDPRVDPGLRSRDLGFRTAAIAQIPAE